jgi:hypothetical protein
MGIKTTFVDITKFDLVEARSQLILKYCIVKQLNLLEVADIGLSKTKKHNLKLVVDNTFLHYQ